MHAPGTLVELSKLTTPSYARVRYLVLGTAHVNDQGRPWLLLLDRRGRTLVGSAQNLKAVMAQDRPHESMPEDGQAQD